MLRSRDVMAFCGFEEDAGNAQNEMALRQFIAVINNKISALNMPMQTNAHNDFRQNNYAARKYKQ